MFTSGVRAETLFQPQVDTVGLALSEQNVSSRKRSVYLKPLISSDVAGFFVGINLVEHRFSTCSKVDDIFIKHTAATLNAALNILSNTEKAWYFVERLNVPSECVALISRYDSAGREIHYDVLTLSPQGDIVWTRDKHRPVMRWIETSSSNLHYTSVWFVGELWVLGIEE